MQVEMEETKHAEADKMAASETAMQGRLRDAQAVISKLQSTTSGLQVEYAYPVQMYHKCPTVVFNCHALLHTDQPVMSAERSMANS